MNIIKSILDILSATLMDPELLAKARRKPGAFTRKGGLLPYLLVVQILISKKQRSYGAILSEFFQNLQERMEISVEDTPICSHQALSKARAGIDHSIFQACFEKVTDYACQHNKIHYEHIKGLSQPIQVIAFDGSRLPLPGRKKLLAHFGGLGTDGSSPTALVSTAFDGCSRLILDASIGPLAPGERAMAIKHMDALVKKKSVDFKNALLVFDRGYASEKMIRYISQTIGSKFLFRLKSKFNVKIDNVPDPSTLDEIVDQNIELYDGVIVRVIKFYITDTIVETLITNDFNIDNTEFKRLYFMRWPIEENYKVLKNKIGLPNFRGYSENSIYQEFWICVLFDNIVHIIKRDTDEIIKQEQDKSPKVNKHQYQTNMNELVGCLSRYICGYLETHDDDKKMSIIKYIYNFATKNRVVDKKGTGESNPRKEPRKTKYYYNVKYTH